MSFCTLIIDCDDKNLDLKNCVIANKIPYCYFLRLPWNTRLSYVGLLLGHQSCN